MRPFRNIPIKQKLTVIIMATTASALLVSGLGTIFADSVLFREYLERDLSVLSRIIADNSTGALAFDDPKSAGETLAALRARTHLIAACIYRQDGTTLASYLRPGMAALCPANVKQDEIRSDRLGLTVARHIMLKGTPIGTLVLRYDLDEVQERYRLYGTTILSVLLVSSLVAFLLSSRLQGIIATPISELANTAVSVSESGDYGIRARKLSGDELGVLVDAFNEMLGRIQARENELEKALVAREAALSEANRTRDLLKTTLSSIGDAVLSTDVDGRVVFANRIAQGLLGLSEAAVTGKPLEELFVLARELDHAKVPNPAIEVLQDRAIGASDNTVLVRKDGLEIPIEVSGAPIRGESGSTEGAVLVFRDVSARRGAEETRRLLASIVESSEDAIIGHDLAGNITSWNKGAERVFGYSQQEMLGKSYSVIAAPGVVDDMPETLQRIGRGERLDPYEAVRRTRSGELIHVSITISPLFNALGRIVGAAKIARDITAQVRASAHLAKLNYDLQKSNEDLERSNKDLERFAFVVSHDLQEPLRMMTIYSQLLVKGVADRIDPQATTYLANITGGANRMRELLSDLLAYTEIGARSEDSLQPVDLNEVIQKVKQNLKASIDETGAVITAVQLPTLNLHESHFISLFQNLIGNAIKYRGEQPPRIKITICDVGPSLRFAVADNGLGIDPQYHEKIFGPFKRLHGKQIPGTGIGLAICQRVVEHYGGKIWVESQLGQGSTFIFELPKSGSSRGGNGS